jgi:multidrug efflux pump subunit AcrA (membrane-fusion protein)
MGQIEESRNERLEALDTLDATRATIEKNIDVLYARAATLEEEERKAEEARLAEIARQAKLEEQRRQEEEAKAQAAAEAARQAERLEAERQEAERQESEAQAARDAAAQEEAARQEAERQAAEAQAEAERQAAEAARAEEERRAAEEQAQAETTPDESVEVVPAQEPEPVDTSNTADWISCVASAYTIADNDPPGSTATASGIPLDDSVPTVAMPMSMNPARFYGSMIQIEYGGLTVVATVTDCGYLSGGARGLDITPAVFRAFGFSSADDWGLREVRYRFL